MSGDMVSAVKIIMQDAKRLVKESPKMDMIENLALNVVENFFYSNMIENFKNNFTEENIEECKITVREVRNINKILNPLFKKCSNVITDPPSKAVFVERDYMAFKDRIKKISKGGFKLLNELEKVAKFNVCKKDIERFKKEIKTLGKKLKIKQFENKDEFGVSLTFE